MGLLSSVWNKIDPFLPDEQIAGLFGQFRGAPQANYDSASPGFSPQPQPQAPVQPRGGGFASALTAFPRALGGAIMDDLRSGPRATAMEDQIRQQIMASVQDPQERAVAMANPSEWAKQRATLGAYHGINGGDVGVFGNPATGGQIVSPSKYGVTEGRGYAIGPNGLQSMGELDPSYGQVTARQNAETNASGFTLGPGARRYGPDGKVIAESPFAPQYRNVGPGDSLVEVGGPQAQAPANPSQMQSLLPPGSRVTSTTRTPQHNAEVGGVANSHHLNGSAIDFVPPPGVTLDQVKQQYAAAGVHLSEALDEGDHFHIAWAAPGGSGAGGSRVVAQGGPKPDNAPNGYRFKPDGALEPIPGGPADPAVSANTKNLKVLPQGAIISYTGNKQAIANIDRAIAAIKQNPDALGGANYIPGPVRDRMGGKGDNNGVNVRALVSGISSQKIHDLSGAAVTASEFPRMRPFIPLATDRADVAIEKLNNMRLIYQGNVDEAQQAYGPDSGYRPFQDGAQPAPAQPAPKAAAPKAGPPMKGPAVGSVIKGYRFKGGDPSSQSNWQKVG